jgi:murein DD-endopeptidase MepM/ murein hydrolase activator NlpD
MRWSTVSRAAGPAGASMSHPSNSHYAHAAPRGQSAAAVSRHVQSAYGGYTLAHAGRQVRVGPVAFWIVVGTLVVMGVWSIATGTYFAFRDDVLTRLIGHQAEMQFAYEDRIAELRATVDRITSRQLLDQEQVERKLESLLRRQSVLESRTSAISGDLLTTGSTHAPRTPQQPTVKPSPINDTLILVAPPDREARLESRQPKQTVTRVAAKAATGSIDGMLSRVSFALDKVEQHQKLALNNLEEQYDTKARRIRTALTDLGVNVDKMPAPAAAVGGPFIPIKPPYKNASAFDHQLYRVNLARAEADRISRALIGVPVRKPVFGEIDMTSPFGVRTDPFLGRPAMHSGIDFRGVMGEPAHATAAGTVTMAGWDGGYGKMVEVDHGNGFSTRYGHLSEIDVKIGQKIRAGEVVGKIGSTGRSTGPHLHYETRINDQPLDPQKFLRAGVRLGGL